MDAACGTYEEKRNKSSDGKSQRERPRRRVRLRLEEDLKGMKWCGPN
jgi:hypothetical protein